MARPSSNAIRANPYICRLWQFVILVLEARQRLEHGSIGNDLTLPYLKVTDEVPNSERTGCMILTNAESFLSCRTHTPSPFHPKRVGMALLVQVELAAIVRKTSFERDWREPSAERVSRRNHFDDTD
jgi:hypothetical protein